MFFDITLDESLLMEAGEDGITSMDDYMDAQRDEQGNVSSAQPADSEESTEDDSTKDEEEIADATDFDTAASNSIFDKEQLEIINGGYPKDQIEKIRKKAERQAKKGNLERVKQLDSLIKNSEQFNSNTPKQRALSLLYQGESQFGDFTRYGEGFQMALADSINNYGWMINNNPYLEFALKATNDGKKTDGVAKSKAGSAMALETIATMLINGELELDNVNLEWMTNEKAYDADDPVFKVKALTLINGKTADDFGDKDLVPDLTNRILDSTKKSDVEYLLQDWQTKDGTSNDRRANNVYKQVEQSVKRGRIKYNPDKLRALFDKSFAEGDKPGETLQKMISSGEWTSIR